jgi:hypothetical protein
MKVKIGPYKHWFGPYQFMDLFKYVIWNEDTRDKLAEKISEKPFKFIDKFRKRKVSVHIDGYDIWSADHTLAQIIHPLLVKMREGKHGAPHIDDSDVPKKLRSTEAENKGDMSVGETDSNYFLRWEYVLDEMIFAFKAHADDDWESEFHSGEIDFRFECVNPDAPKEKQMFEMLRGPNDTHVFDKAGYEKKQKRIANGMRLFGKYYGALWT